MEQLVQLEPQSGSILVELGWPRRGNYSYGPYGYYGGNNFWSGRNLVGLGLAAAGGGGGGYGYGYGNWAIGGPGGGWWGYSPWRSNYAWNYWYGNPGWNTFAGYYGWNTPYYYDYGARWQRRLPGQYGLCERSTRGNCCRLLAVGSRAGVRHAKSK